MNAAWVQLLKAVVLAIAGWLSKRFRPTAVDGEGPGRLEDRLKRKIEEDKRRG